MMYVHVHNLHTYIHTCTCMHMHTCIHVHTCTNIGMHICIVLTLRYQSNHQRINDNMRKSQTRRANIRVWAVCKNHTHVHQNAHYIYIHVLTLRYQSNHQRINDNMRKCQTRRANIRVWAVCKNHTHVHQNAHFTHPEEVHIAWNLRNKRTPQLGVLDPGLAWRHFVASKIALCVSLSRGLQRSVTRVANGVVEQSEGCVPGCREDNEGRDWENFVRTPPRAVAKPFPFALVRVRIHCSIMS